MPLLGSLAGASVKGFGAQANLGYFIGESLRFRGAQHLERTPTAVGDQTTWTWSAWVKRGKIGTQSGLFNAYNNDNNRAGFGFDSGDKMYVFRRAGGVTSYSYQPDMLFRDTAAWYHIVVKMDQSQSTASDRLNIYVNGQLLTDDNGDYPALSEGGTINNTQLHAIGRQGLSGGSNYFDGYMGDIYFVDGQALTASDFGKTDPSTGQWIPKKYSGTYGTNGFKLDFKHQSSASGFNTVTYQATATDNLKITGVGFSPDLVWTKSRDNTYSHDIYDSVRGATKRLQPNGSGTELSAPNSLTSFDSDGFTLNDQDNSNYTSGSDSVAWCWDAGSSTASNTDGSITSSVRANPATGFSIATYTGNNTASTIGHGLGTAPKVIILKQRTAAGGDVNRSWILGHDSLGWQKALKLSETDAELVSNPIWNATAPTSSVFTIGNSNTINYNGSTYVAYCFSEVSGYSKFGSYTGTGASGNSITTGFRPAFLMVKRSDSTGSWVMYDNTRDVDGTLNDYLLANTNGAETASEYATISDTGFTMTGSFANASGGTFVYMAFADTRDTAFWRDKSGTDNHWTLNAINYAASEETTYDLMSDTPSLVDEDTGNFATWNPLDQSNCLITNGNLTIKGNYNTSSFTTARATIGVSNTCYFEFTTSSLNLDDYVGFMLQDQLPVTNGSSVIGYSTYPNSLAVRPANGTILYNSSTLGTYTAFSANDIGMIAYDASTGKVWVGKNGTWYNSGDPAAGTGNVATLSTSSGTYAPAFTQTQRTEYHFNFGQRPFKYTPPTGFKKLNTYNL